jgi:hypothetical protein
MKRYRFRTDEQSDAAGVRLASLAAVKCGAGSPEGFPLRDVKNSRPDSSTGCFRPHWNSRVVGLKFEKRVRHKSSWPRPPKMLSCGTQSKLS